MLTVPKVIASGDSVTIPAGRVAVLPDVQVDGTLNVLGDIFIPSGTANSKVVQKVASTDNAIVRFNGTTGDVQNSGVFIDDNNSVGIDTAGYTGYGRLGVVGQIGVNCSSADTVSARGLQFFADGVKFTNLSADNSANLVYIGNGGIGYGTGSGTSVTQITNKSTNITLVSNKATGRITMANTALAAGASVDFVLYSNVIGTYDQIICNPIDGSVADPRVYRVRASSVGSGYAWIRVTNESASSLSEALQFTFSIIKGVIS